MSRAAPVSNSDPLPVYVIHWNAPELAAEAIRSILESTGAGVSITLIDNRSTRESWELLERSGVLASIDTIRLPSNTGFTGAVEIAWKDATTRAAEWMVVAAHDVLVRPDTIVNLLATASAATYAGAVGPVFRDESWQRPVKQGAYWEEGRGARDVRMDAAFFGGKEYREIDWIPGALMLMRVECLARIGGFDDDLFAYCEDLDFCLRARDAGYRVCVSKKALAREQTHVLPTASRIFLIARNSLLLIQKRSGRAAFMAATFRTLLASLRAAIGSLLPTRTSERRTLSRHFAMGQFRAAVAALRGERGAPPWTTEPVRRGRRARVP